jgi:hypothetical protein
MAFDGLALAQDRHSRVVVQPLGGQYMLLDQRIKRLQRRRIGADQVGQCRQAQVDALPPIAFALAVQRLVLAKLLEQDHGQQVGAGEAAWRGVERRRRLGDGLARPARELLAHRLDHLPLARHDLQRRGDVLARSFGLGTCRNRLRFQARGALRNDHRMRVGKIRGQRFRRRCHAATESYSHATSKLKPSPTDVGRHVSCGCLQSMAGQQVAELRRRRSTPRRRLGSATRSGPAPAAS